MKVRFLEIAQIELDEAVTYYDTESAGLGQVFLLEVLYAIERIRQFPNAWHPLSANTRRCRTRRFPFGVIYQAMDNDILIVPLPIFIASQTIGGIGSRGGEYPLQCACTNELGRATASA